LIKQHVNAHVVEMKDEKKLYTQNERISFKIL